MRVRATVSIGSDTGGANDESRGSKGQSASFDQVHEKSEERVIDGEETLRCIHHLRSHQRP